MMFGVKIYRYVQLLLIFPLLYKVGTTQNIDKKKNLILSISWLMIWDMVNLVAMVRQK